MTTRWQVAFLTGQSDPPRCALSDSQQRFIAAVAPDRAVPLNFPYDPQGGEFRPTPLLRASCNNAHQYWASRRIAFRREHRAGVERLLARSERSLLLVGSCGLELFNNLHLPIDLLDRIAVFAYGPVARRRPDCTARLVQGRRDWLSRCWFRTADAQVDAGHMDYLVHDTVLAQCRDWFAHVQATT